MAKDICKFDEQTYDNEGQPKVVQFANLCIIDAGVLCFVLRQLLLQDYQELLAAPPEPVEQAAQLPGTIE
jgi:hypothetical protein